MLYDGYKTFNPAWIVWFAMLFPDSDFVAQTIWEEAFPTKITPIIHGSFHNIFAMVILSLVIGWLIWKTMRVPFKHAALCVGLGFSAHMLEDALVNGIVYHFYTPFSDRGWYQGFIIHPTIDLVYANSVIASSNILYIGAALLILTMTIRTMIQGTDWLEKYWVFVGTPIQWVRIVGNQIRYQVKDMCSMSTPEPYPEYHDGNDIPSWKGKV